MLRSASARLLLVIGVVVFVASWFLPVMRWNESAAHPTRGSARVFIGSGFTLVDGGFPGSALVPVAAVAAAAMGLVAASDLMPRLTWWTQVAAVVAIGYYLLWVVYVFLRKLEDDVFPGEGALALILAAASFGLAAWRGRRSD